MPWLWWGEGAAAAASLRTSKARGRHSSPPAAREAHSGAERGFACTEPKVPQIAHLLQIDWVCSPHRCLYLQISRKLICPTGTPRAPASVPPQRLGPPQ